METEYTVADLFCGCGGLSLGFERAGFKILAAYDNWHPAVSTYNVNFHHTAHLVDLSEDPLLPRSTLIIGGPPCQGFSSAGLRKLSDERNTCIRVFSKIIARHKPQAFVFENVEGFLTGAGGRFIFDLLEPLIDVGYRIHLRKVNAANFGIPQHRKRVIAIGGLGWDPTFPIHTHSTFGAPGSTLANGRHLPFSPTFADAVGELPQATPRNSRINDSHLDHSYSPFNEADKARARVLQPGQRMRDLPEEMWHDSYKRRAYRRVMDGTPTERRGGAPAGLRRLSSDEPSKAITSGALREFVHPTEDRPLTIRECARLQTFPDKFLFPGTQSEKTQMIGNAVPVRLAEIIANTVREDLQKARKTYDKGALLSFVPTLSTGMSIALKSVSVQVQDRFLSKTKLRQMCLCT
jgi:DNA (cytosine-5)-methyltransferase 1